MEFQTEPLCRVTVQGISCQRLGEREEEQEQYHLVLTDPPYSDHVPYLEYSALWTEVLGLPVPARSLREEIVNSDSPERRVDSGQYARRLGDGFDACARLVRPGGYLVWFYNDTALGHWLEISNRARACGVGIMDVIAIPKQRRSMKTVTSPDRTLDGDLICVFQKGRACADGGEDRNLEQVMAHLRQGLARGGDDMSHFERYALLIKEALLWGGIAALEARYGKVTQVLKELNG